MGEMLILKLKTNDRVRIRAEEAGGEAGDVSLKILSVGTKNVRVGFDTVRDLTRVSLSRGGGGNHHERAERRTG